MSDRINPLLAPAFIDTIVWPALWQILVEKPNIAARELRAAYEQATNTDVPPAIWTAWLDHVGLRPERRTVWVQDPAKVDRYHMRPSAPIERRPVPSGEPARAQRPTIMEDQSMMSASEQMLAAQTFGVTAAAGYVEPPTDGFKFDNE